MNWEAISAIGEFVSAVAVIVTIGYLAIQVRQNTTALRSVATQGVTDQAALTYHALCSDPEMTAIFIRGCNAIDELNDTDKGRYYSFFMMTLFHMQNWYFQTRAEHIDNTLLASWTRILQQIATSKGFQMFWNDRKFIFAPEFQKYLDAEGFGKASDAIYKPLGSSGKQ